MDLSFEQKGSEWIATAAVSGDYALHLERAKGGWLRLEQTSVEGGLYAKCNLPQAFQNAPRVIDHTFAHGVYPMNIKIRSASEVVSGTITENE